MWIEMVSRIYRGDKRRTGLIVDIASVTEQLLHMLSCRKCLKLSSWVTVLNGANLIGKRYLHLQVQIFSGTFTVARTGTRPVLLKQNVKLVTLIMVGDCSPYRQNDLCAMYALHVREKSNYGCFPATMPHLTLISICIMLLYINSQPSSPQPCFVD